MYNVYRKIKCKATYTFAPKKVYVVNPLKSSLCKLFGRKEIITALEEWRHRNVITNEMSDIYDRCVQYAKGLHVGLLIIFVPFVRLLLTT